MIWVALFRFLFIWSLFDGFLGLMFPAKFVLLSRDVILLGTYFLFFTRESFTDIMRELKYSLGDAAWFALGGFFIVGLFQIFNPTTPGLIVGLLGFKVVYYYIPIMLLAFTIARDMQTVRRLLMMIVLASIPINIFGIIQFFKGPSWMLGTFGPGLIRALYAYQGVDESKVLFRALGTFSAGGIYAIFLVANSVFCICLIYSAKIHKRLWLWVSCLILDLVAILITGTRGALLMIVLYLIVYAFVSKRARATMMTGLLIAVGFYIGFSFLGQKTVDRFTTLKDVDMIQERTVGVTGAMFYHYVDRYPIGKGLGAASQATRHLGARADDFRITVENYASKLQVETGLPGVLCFYLFMFFLFSRILFNWKYLFLEEDEPIIIPIAAYCISQFAFQGIFGSIETSPGSLFLWAGIGFCARRASEGRFAREEAYNQIYRSS